MASESEQSLPWHDIDYWTLARLRDAGYARLVPAPPEGKESEQVRTGKTRKVYSNRPSPEFLQFRPCTFRGFNYDMPSEQLLTPEQLRLKIDTRSLDELISGPTEALRQLLLRAAAGDETAISFFAEKVRDLARQLATLEKCQPDKLRALAQTCDRWPVLLSLNPQDIKAAKERLEKLRVGSHADIPTRPGQRVDRGNYWTRLAQWAVDQCKEAGTLVKIFEHHATKAGAKAECVPLRNKAVSGKRLNGTCYHVREGNTFNALIVTDWERQCASLMLPLTKENFDGWRKVVREFVREYLASSKEAYAKAMDSVGQKGLPEYERRDIIMKRVEQALRAFIGKPSP